MTTSIADLRAASNAALDAQAAIHGENTVLTNQADIDGVSHALDTANETWNNDLPPRPSK